ncbi:hypothetical protein CQW23_23517 [Capsicum baccatum]|uniref:DNA-3-methyladenine glycosylase 1 n=1 Tax=Capsicum baccatum TaxID=33114 RepID=A0A2G2VS56_CAPBA|nr:hypothetical protein CQW23_23517 [Capsicum baccatum]
MCSYKFKKQGERVVDISPETLTHINGRPVLQPCNNSHKKSPNFKISPYSKVKNSPPISPKIRSPRQQSIKKVNSDPNGFGLNTSSDKIVTPKNPKVKNSTLTTTPISPKIKSPRQQPIKKVNDSNGQNPSSDKIVTPKYPKVKNSTLTTPPISPKNKSPRQPAIKKVKNNNNSSIMVLEVAGSIAAARREQVANMQVQRKQRIAHYGRTNSAKFNEAKLITAAAVDSSSKEGRRCSFITPNSDPVYIAYHDEEWGVPVHDDNLLFELLVLTVAQVGADWTSVLKKRQDFRDAFSGFDPEIVAKYNEKKINSTSTEYGIELSQVRGVVDNSKRILEIKRQLGSFHKYLWGFVSSKPITTLYKACNKIPVKTSKSETMSKDMVKRGFRYVGPTVIHSFMQAVGLTNDHIITCPRHVQCATLATQEHIAM